MKNDSRFFDGYIWCAESPDCRMGLCMPGTDQAAAAEMYAGRWRTWYSRGNSRDVYTMRDAWQPPQRHVIQL